jgi:hypothetical protein
MRSSTLSRKLWKSSRVLLSKLLCECLRTAIMASQPLSLLRHLPWARICPGAYQLLSSTSRRMLQSEARHHRRTSNHQCPVSELQSPHTLLVRCRRPRRCMSIRRRACSTTAQTLARHPAVPRSKSLREQLRQRHPVLRVLDPLCIPSSLSSPHHRHSAAHSSSSKLLRQPRTAHSSSSNHANHHQNNSNRHQLLRTATAQHHQTHMLPPRMLELDLVLRPPQPPHKPTAHLWVATHTPPSAVARQASTQCHALPPPNHHHRNPHTRNNPNPAQHPAPHPSREP